MVLEVTEMSQPCRPLKDVLAEISDLRQASGKRHSLVAILSLVCAATLCGYRSYSAMAEWGRNYGRSLMAALGFTHPTPPCTATLHRVLRHVDRQEVESYLGAWAEEALAAANSAAWSPAPSSPAIATGRVPSKSFASSASAFA